MYAEKVFKNVNKKFFYFCSENIITRNWILFNFFACTICSEFSRSSTNSISVPSSNFFLKRSSEHIKLSQNPLSINLSHDFLRLCLEYLLKLSTLFTVRWVILIFCMSKKQKLRRIHSSFHARFNASFIPLYAQFTTARRQKMP